jgi:ribose 5-phosphate isomerase A
VIMVEENKIVERLGATHRLPVEVTRFGWTTTRKRLLMLTDTADLRVQSELPVLTSEGNYLIDVTIPEGPLDEFANALKLTLGVVDHGLFLDQANEVIVGKPDGSIEIHSRPQL